MREGGWCLWEAVQRSCCARKGAICCSKALKTRAVALETQTEQFAKHFGALQALAKLKTSSGAFLLPENPGINGQLICEPAGKDVLMRRLEAGHSCQQSKGTVQVLRNTLTEVNVTPPKRFYVASELLTYPSQFVNMVMNVNICSISDCHC